MKAALDQFGENLSRARSLCGLADSLAALTTEAVDSTDLYRASLVLGVSAVDHFVHEFVRLGMVEVHSGSRAPTEAHLAFKVPLSVARAAIADASDGAWLDGAVREAHSWLSFQHPDKIADAIRLVSGVRLWEEVAREMGTDSRAVKAQLSAIVDRRNKIAHEADLDPTNPGQRWPIDGELVRNALSYLDQVVRAIFQVAI